MEEADASGFKGGEDPERDDLYEKAINLVATTGQASASFIQRRLRVGYPRAARMIEMMEEDQIIGPASGGKPREVLVRRAVPGEAEV
jgi:S-DNA-T family DNA segregation ATPase FtsK/SpoIIIE